MIEIVFMVCSKGKSYEQFSLCAAHASIPQLHLAHAYSGARGNRAAYGCRGLLHHQVSIAGLAIFLLYELSVFIVGFLGKVWGKLEDPLAEHIAA